MLVLFWLGVIWLGYIWLGYPLILSVLALFRRVHPKIDENYEPAVSVLISARNEVRNIGSKIDQTLSWNYPHNKLQVLVASDASEDGTDAIIKAYDDSRLVFVRMNKRSGKNAALNRLMQEATGDILFFTDANTIIDANCIRRLLRHFADDRVGCVTGEMRYVKGNQKAAASGSAWAYWRYESFIKRLESTIGSVLVCVGSVFCIRRSLFSPLHLDLANDLETPMLIGETGSWLRYEPNARSAERVGHSLLQEARRRIRICGQGFIGMWRLRRTLRGLRGWQFISRKAFRWFTFLQLAVIFVATIALSNQPIFNVLLKVELICLGFVATGGVLALTDRGSISLFSIPFYYIFVSASGFYGVVSALMGKRFQTWEPSTRSGDESWDADHL